MFLNIRKNMPEALILLQLVLRTHFIVNIEGIPGKTGFNQFPENQDS